MDKYLGYEAVLDLLKQLMPDDQENPNPNYDLILDFTLNKVFNDVSIYTNIPVKKLPKKLKATIISLTMQLVDTYQLLTPEDQQTSNISSLTEGDTSVTFKSLSEIYSELQSANTITSNYVNVLNSFRRIQL